MDVNKEIKKLRNYISNTERLINLVANPNEKKKLESELKNALTKLHMLKKMQHQINVKTKYTNVNNENKTNKNTKLKKVDDDIYSSIKSYINTKSKFKVGDYVILKDGRKGYIENLYINTRLLDLNNKLSGIIATLKRARKDGKKHHLWLSKYGIPIEDIKEKIK